MENRSLANGPIDGIIESLRFSHFSGRGWEPDHIKLMIKTGQISSVTGLVLTLMKMSRPDAALTVLRQHLEGIDPNVRDRTGRNLEELAMQCQDNSDGCYAGMYESILKLVMQMRKMKDPAIRHELNGPGLRGEKTGESPA
ncbi:MAG: hypothetical protein LVQ95_04465 [Candidatus Micrarchaeales archaeon]|nr:hypothetical protein [Candidatus Micrarchaeales archaeon]